MAEHIVRGKERLCWKKKKKARPRVHWKTPATLAAETAFAKCCTCCALSEQS